MEEFLYTHPEQLLEEHQHLLFLDFVALAPGPTKDKLVWIAEINSALGAAAHVAWGSCHAVWMCYCCSRRPQLQTEYKSVLVDTEGSMQWRWQPRQPLSLIYDGVVWSVPCSRLWYLLYFGGQERQLCLQFAISK
jgi:hypothetical protein